MLIKFKEEVIEKNVLLEEGDKTVLTNFLKIMKVIINLLDDDDFYLTDCNGEELDYQDLEYIANIFERFLNEGVITITKCC